MIKMDDSSCSSDMWSECSVGKRSVSSSSGLHQYPTRDEDEDIHVSKKNKYILWPSLEKDLREASQRVENLLIFMQKMYR